VDFLASNNVYILIMNKASQVFTLRDGNFFDIDMADLEICPKDRKLQFELVFEFPFCVIIKAVLRRRLLVFNGETIRLAKHTRKIDIFFRS
jgi:hypothetical protein